MMCDRVTAVELHAHHSSKPRRRASVHSNQEWFLNLHVTLKAFIPPSKDIIQLNNPSGQLSLDSQ